MKLERKKKKYYINSVAVSKEALEMIFKEVVKIDACKKIFTLLTKGETVNVHFDPYQCLEATGNSLEQEQKKNRILESKLAALEKMYLKQTI